MSETTDAADRHRTLIADALHALANCVDKMKPVGQTDWVDAAATGDMLSSDEAGFIIDKSADTAVRWFDAAAEEGFPLGIRRAGVCLFSLRRLLIWVEQHKGGLSARLACETRARKLAELRGAPQNRQQIAPDAA